MNIRHAESSDVKEIRRVAMDSWLDTYSSILSEESIREVVDEWYDTHELHDQVEDAVFFVAEKDGEIVGFIHASVNGKSHLHRLYLKPDFQGQGLGTQLYTRMEEELEKYDIDTIELEALSGNEKGLGFYRSKGFEEKSEREVELKGEKVLEKVMVKTV